MGVDKLKGFKGFFGGNSNGDDDFDDNKDDRPINEDEFYDVKRENAREAGSSKMILVEPRSYSESQQIADFLKKRSTVVVNLKRVTPDQAKRIVDFLSGTLYAINGGLQKLGTGIFLCTPNNVNVEGSITDENKEKVLKKEVKNDDEEVDW